MIPTNCIDITDMTDTEFEALLNSRVEVEVAFEGRRTVAADAIVWACDGKRIWPLVARDWKDGDWPVHEFRWEAAEELSAWKRFCRESRYQPYY